MTNILEIQYSRESNVVLELEDYLYFTGANIEIKQAIIKCLNRFSTGKTLSDIEENIFGEDGIQIIYDSKKISSRNVKVISVNSLDSMMNELTNRRGSLLYDELISVENNLDIGIQMTKVNDELLKLETIVNEELKYLSNDAIYQFKDIIFKDMISKQLEVTYHIDEIEVPINYRSNIGLVSEFVNLIENNIARTGKMIWIVIDQPYSFLTEDIFKNLLEELLNISKKTKLLKLFIFNNIMNNSDFEFELEKTVLLYDTYQQLPSIEIFRKSIERNYPDTLTIKDEELSCSFFRICHLIGKKIDRNHTIGAKDMILLIILKDLLGDNTSIETSISELSRVEKEFLNSKF